MTSVINISNKAIYGYNLPAKSLEVITCGYAMSPKQTFSTPQNFISPSKVNIDLG